MHWSMCDTCSFLSLLTGQGSAPLNLNVTLTSSDEVLSLRSRIAELEKQLLEQTAVLKRAEYNLMCEYALNTQLADYLRERDIKVPPRYFAKVGIDA